MISRPDNLTAKQWSFIQAYTNIADKTTFNNGMESAKYAGYKGNDHQLGVIANQNLNKLCIIDAIADIEADRLVRTEYNQQEAQRRLNEQYVKANTQNDVTAAVACIRESNTIYALRKEGAVSGDAEQVAKLKAEQELEAQRIANIRLHQEGA